MRIVLATDAWFPQVNGVVRTWSEVRREVEARGHEVCVVHPAQFNTIPCPRYPEIRLAVLPDRLVAEMLRDLEPDAIHVATEGPIGLAARNWCVRHGVAFTTSYHTQFPQYLRMYAGIPVGVTHRMLRWFHGPASTTLVPTESIRRELAAASYAHLRTWTRGVDRTLFHPRPRTLYPDDPRPIFLYAGRVTREKNLEAFLGADLPGTKHVVGDGPHLPELRARFPATRFTGYKHGEELAHHYANADVFVFPSRTDTFGVVLLEAMACGVPVAAFPVTGPRDVVVDGVCGALDENLATAARRALEIDPSACVRHAEGFGWGRCAEIVLVSLVPVRGARRRSA